MILGRKDILEAIAAGRIVLDPYDEGMVGAASIDLRLSRHFRRLQPSDEPVEILPDLDYRNPAYSQLVSVPEDGYLDVKPGEALLGITAERISISGDLCARLEGRSRFARLGLLIHISAGFVAPGTNNHQVLEISNLSRRPLRLYPKVAVCQCIFELVTSPAQHKGRYMNQGIDDFLASPEG